MLSPYRHDRGACSHRVVVAVIHSEREKLPLLVAFGPTNTTMKKSNNLIVSVISKFMLHMRVCAMFKSVFCFFIVFIHLAYKGYRNSFNYWIDLPISQCLPCQPKVQLHEYDPSELRHVAPFRHGCDVLHSLTSKLDKSGACGHCW